MFTNIIFFFLKCFLLENYSYLFKLSQTFEKMQTFMPFQIVR